MKTLFAGAFSLVLSLFAVDLQAALNTRIIVSVETPAPGQVYTGALFVRGWSVAPAGIQRVELYIDGEFLLDIPIGESRPDVAGIYPPGQYPGSDTSGFNIGFFYSRFANGGHTATIRAIDTAGDHNEIVQNFQITRFDTSQPNNFIRDLSIIDLTGASIAQSGSLFQIAGMVVENILYTVEVQWNTTLQGLAISRITPLGTPPSEIEISGAWDVTDSFDSENCVGVNPEDFPPGYTDLLDLERQGNVLNGMALGPLPLSGTVGPNGDFELSGIVTVGQIEAMVCDFAVTIEMTGNFSSGSYTEAFVYEFFGFCEELRNCTVQYSGSIVPSASSDTSGSGARARSGRTIGHRLDGAVSRQPPA